MVKPWENWPLHLLTSLCKWKIARLIYSPGCNSLWGWTISLSSLEAVLDVEFWGNCHRGILRGWITGTTHFHGFPCSENTQTFKANIQIYINTGMDCVLNISHPKMIFCFMFLMSSRNPQEVSPGWSWLTLKESIAFHFLWKQKCNLSPNGTHCLTSILKPRYP